MTIQWIKTNHKGLRYYEHLTRKHGKKFDRYYAIRFKVDKKEHGYGIGWLSEGVPDEIRKEHHNIGFEEYCLMLLRQYKGNLKTGSGPQSPKEKRKIEETKRKEAAVEKEQIEKDTVTFNEIFTEQYYPIAKQNKKKGTATTEDGLFRLWIDPVIGKLPLKGIAPIHLERIKKNMADEGRAPRYIQYMLALVRQVFNYAKDNDSFNGICPVLKVKMPKFDNKRLRFLTYEEAELLLTALKTRSIDVYHMALLSLSSGMRAGEVFSLQWSDVNTEAGIITLRNTKNSKTRHCSMTDIVKEMFAERKPGKKSDLVFPSTRGAKIVQISDSFDDAVKELKLNVGIDDPRHRVYFHSLRHTYASWLVQGGVSLYVVQRMLGHSQISQTERYSHLHSDTITDAVKIFEVAWQKDAVKSAQYRTPNPEKVEQS